MQEVVVSFNYKPQIFSPFLRGWGHSRSVKLPARQTPPLQRWISSRRRGRRGLNVNYLNGL